MFDLLLLAPGIFDWGSPNVGSERTVELSCGKLLLTDMTTFCDM